MPRPTGSAVRASATRLHRAPASLLAMILALVALLGTVEAPTAQAAPAAAPEYWRTVGNLNLAQTHGMTYVSQADPRWSGQRMASIPHQDYFTCACIISAIASLVNYAMPLPGDTVPFFPTTYRVPRMWPQPAEERSELLWSSPYLDNLFVQRGQYETLEDCGTMPVPQASETVGIPRQILDRDGKILASAPTGIALVRHDLADKDPDGNRFPVADRFNTKKDLVASELVAGRPVMMGRRTPKGGGHIYLIVGLDQGTGHFLSYNVGWLPGKKPSEALMTSQNETYEAFEDSITDIWTYRPTIGGLEAFDWIIRSGGGGFVPTGAPAETFELAVTTPDGRRIGYDPSTGLREVSEGSFAAGGFVQGDALTGEPLPSSDPVAHQVYVREPVAGRYFAEVHPTAGGGSVQTALRDRNGTVLADVAVDVPGDGAAKIEVDRAADGSVTTTQVDQFGPQAVVDGPTTAKAGQALEFDASESFDADGDVESYEWDLGDGTTISGERTVTHAFDAPGTYDVRLTVTDDDGATRTVTHTVTVAKTDDVNPDVTFEPQGGAWQQQPFDVTVTGQDSGRGVRTTTYEATGATTVPSTSVDGDTSATVRIADEGRTTITARAVDRDGNQSPVRTTGVGVDTAAPSSTVTTPEPGGRTAGLGIVAGATTDATSGAEKVELTLRRESDGAYWTGTAWGAAETWLPTGMGSAAGDRWFATSGLPTGAELARGTYRLRSRAVDRAGNVETPGGGTTFEVTASALPSNPPAALEVPAGSSATVEAVDDDGTAVGRVHTTLQAVRWDPDGTRTVLPALPGHTSAWAQAISDGTIVGHSGSFATGDRAVVWRDGVPTDLGQLAAGKPAAATGVDAEGRAVGTAHDAEGRPRPVRFTDPGPQLLPSMPGVDAMIGEAHAVSPSGRFVVGLVTGADGEPVTVRWDGGTAQPLERPYDIPSAVNDDGVVTGTATIAGMHAVMWDAGGALHDLGPGAARDVDARGTVVGHVENPPGGRPTDAAWWQGGGMSRLTETLAAGSPWVLFNAQAVSPTTGIVAGTGRDGSGAQLFRLQAPALTGELDVVPPAVSATPDTDAWHRDDVELTVRATDAGSGVASVRTSVTGDVAGDRVGVPVTAEGETRVAYAATDAAGNLSATRTATVRIDRTAPEAAVRRFGPDAPWARSDVTVVLSGSDALSGVAELRWTVDGGPEQRSSGGSHALTLTDDGVHAVSVVAVDAAGNVSAPATTEVRIDRTAPEPRIDVLNGAARPTGAVASATDATSGVAATTLTHEVDGRTVPVEGLQTALAGTGSHRLLLTVTDAAGNSAQQAVDVEVPAIPGLEAEPAGAPPAADAGGPYRAVAGVPIRLDGSRSASPSGGPLEYAWTVDDVGSVAGERPEVIWARPGRYLVSLEVRDGERWSRNEPGDSSRVVVEVRDPASEATADAGPDRTGTEGAAIALGGSVSEGATATWTADDPSTCRFADPAAAATTVTCADEAVAQLTLTATSPDGVTTAVDTVEVTVVNAAPTVELRAPAEAVLGTPVTVAATVADPGVTDVLTCRFEWPGGGGTTVPAREGTCAASRVLDQVGPQTVHVLVGDGDGGTAEAGATVAVRYAVTLPEGGTVNPGRAIPVTFGLGGDHGPDVLVEAVSVRLDEDGQPVGAEVPAVTPGAGGLSYATGTARYHWNWDTAKDWRGQTRALILRFDDGSEHRVVHRFRGWAAQPTLPRTSSTITGSRMTMSSAPRTSNEKPLRIILVIGTTPEP